MLQGEEQQQPPSIKLASILPAQLTAATSNSSSLEPAALSALPVELQQQHQQVAQLWQQLQQYMEDFKGLRSMVQHLVGSAAHPYAIDAVQLRAYGQAGGFEGMAAAPAAGESRRGVEGPACTTRKEHCRHICVQAGKLIADQQELLLLPPTPLSLLLLLLCPSPGHCCTG